MIYSLIELLRGVEFFRRRRFINNSFSLLFFDLLSAIRFLVSGLKSIDISFSNLESKSPLSVSPIDRKLS